MLIKLHDFDIAKDVFGYGYGGATGPKAVKEIDGRVYIVKRQERIRDNQYDISYVNDPISEYIGSHIYNLIGLPVHETILGRYKGRYAVGCKDFSIEAKQTLVEFRYLKNTIVDDDMGYDISGMSRHLENILKAIDYLFKDGSSIAVFDVLKRFWSMFVIDALIGNADRNNGNWGFIRDDGGRLSLSPVYDCGSCLNYRRPDSKLEQDIKDDVRLNNLALNYTFNFMYSGKLINPFHYIERNPGNVHIRYALGLIHNLSMEKVDELVDSMEPVCSPVRMEYYRRILRLRYDRLCRLC